MIASLIFALPMAMVWMMVTATLSLESFAVGLLLGLSILLMVRSQSTQISLAKLPDQLTAFAIYSLTLCRDIWLSTMDVTKRILSPDLPLAPGIIRVPTQDENECEIVAAVSAHGITITPGELVLGFEDKHTMFVHCLDAEASKQTVATAQSKRLHLLNRILGRTPIAPLMPVQVIHPVSQELSL